MFAAGDEVEFTSRPSWAPEGHVIKGIITSIGDNYLFIQLPREDNRRFGTTWSAKKVNDKWLAYRSDVDYLEEIRLVTKGTLEIEDFINRVGELEILKTINAMRMRR